MRILAIGLIGADPDLLFGDERLSNVRRLMEMGCYGRLQDVLTQPVEWGWSQAPAVWDQIGRSDRRVLIVAATPLSPPPQVSGVWVSCRLSLHGSVEIAAYPENVRETLVELMKEHTADAPGCGRDRKGRLRNRVYVTSCRRFAIGRYLMQTYDWDYCEFDERGLDSSERPGGDDQALRSDYCCYIDRQLGTILELLDDNTAILIAARRDMQDSRGAFILAGRDNPLHGEIFDACSLDMAPTLLDIGGYAIPASMQGRSLLAGQTLDRGSKAAYSADEEELIRQQLRGLGYIE